MSNNFTKTYQDGQALTEAQLDTAFQTVKPSRANLDFSSFGSVSGHVLQSQGSNVTPEWVSLNEVVADTTISSTAANKILTAATTSGANAVIADANSSAVPTAGFANKVINAVTAPAAAAANSIINAYTRTSAYTSAAGLRGIAQVPLSNTVVTTTSTVTLCTATLVTSGRPIHFDIFGLSVSFASTVRAGFLVGDSAGSIGEADVFVQVNGGTPHKYTIYTRATGSTRAEIRIPSISGTIPSTAGTNTIVVLSRCTPGDFIQAEVLDLVAYEI
jgi:hypothetical protein